MPRTRLQRTSAAFRHLSAGAVLIGLLLSSQSVGAARNRVQSATATVSTVAGPVVAATSVPSNVPSTALGNISDPQPGAAQTDNRSFESQRSEATAAAVAAGILVPGRPRRLADMAISSAGAARIQRESGIDARRYAQLAKDRTVHIDQTGRILFVDSVPKPPAAGSIAVEAHQAASALTPTEGQGAPLPTVPSAQTFLLHSRPGSSRTLYLDFNGTTLTESVWDYVYNQDRPLVLAPYDSDGSPSSFSATEHALIQRVWRAVAEDFAPFDVNVTTEEPAVAALQRTSIADLAYGTSVVITPTNVTCVCSGVAYLHSFSGSEGFKPALVYTDDWWNTSPEDIANIAAHEAGHAFGLSHDGVGASEYYGGHGSWQSIMGSAAYWQRPYSHWSKGEYSNANNVEDDIAIISGNAPLVADDHGWTIATATELAVPSSTVTGHIGNDSDVDVFGFNGRVGVDAVVDANDVGPNLVPTLSLMNAAGNVVTSVVGSGVRLRANFSSPARYYLMVSAEPVGSPLNGISGYGNLGRYQLLVESAPLPVAPSNLTSVTGIGTVTFQWSDINNNLSSTNYEVSYCTGSTCQTTTVVANGASPRSLQVPGLTVGAVYTFQVRASNERGVSNWVSGPQTGSVQGYGPVEITSVAASSASHTFGWGIPAKIPTSLANPAIYSVRWRNVTDGGAWNESTTIGSTFSISNPVPNAVYQFQVRAGDGLGYFGAWGSVREAITGREVASAAATTSSLVPSTRAAATGGLSVPSAGRPAAPPATGMRATG